MAYRIALLRRRSLADRTVEVGFLRPRDMPLQAGQKITLRHQELARDYTPINAPESRELLFCVRHVPGGRLSSLLVNAPMGAVFQASTPFGYFTCQRSARPAVLVATGTGIAPFVAYVRSGMAGFTLLHGVRTEAHLYYRGELEAAARHYIACLSSDSRSGGSSAAVYHGRVTGYLEHALADGVYDFYLCGRTEMIRDATGIIDRRFPGSSVFSEPFF